MQKTVGYLKEKASNKIHKHDILQQSGTSSDVFVVMFICLTSPHPLFTPLEGGRGDAGQI